MVVVEFSDDEVDRIFHALADATRRDILARVMSGGESVSGLGRRYAMSFAAVQKHVAVLERASLVTKQRRGREQIVSGDAATIKRATSLLTRYEKIWHDRADRIGDILSDQKKKEGRP